jgi:uncharacterized membrane protein YphA (DoxX/SURF4 family)
MARLRRAGMEGLRKYFGLILRLGLGGALAMLGLAKLRTGTPAMPLALHVSPVVISLVGILEIFLALLLVFGLLTRVAALAAALIAWAAVLLSPLPMAQLRLSVTAAAGLSALALSLLGGGLHALERVVLNRTSVTRRAGGQTAVGLLLLAVAILLLALLPSVGVPLSWTFVLVGAAGLLGALVLWWHNPICECITYVPTFQDGSVLVLRAAMTFACLGALLAPMSHPLALPWPWVLIVLCVALALGIFVRAAGLVLLGAFAVEMSRTMAPYLLVGMAAALVLVLAGGGRFSLLRLLRRPRPAPRVSRRARSRKKDAPAETSAKVSNSGPTA